MMKQLKNRLNRIVEEYNNFGYLTKIYCSDYVAAEELEMGIESFRNLLRSGALYNHRRYKFYYAKGFGLKNDGYYPIKQYDPESGIVINQFHTIVEAARVMGYHRNRISDCIYSNGERLDKWGFAWKRISKYAE